MKSKNYILPQLVAIAMLSLAFTAEARTPKEEPVTPSGGSPAAVAGAAAGALGIGEGGHGLGIGQGGDAAGGDAAGGAGGEGGIGNGGAGGLGGTGGSGVGNGRVDVGGDRLDAKALALGHIRAAPAAAVITNCHEHSRGWDVTVGSRTGGIHINEACAKRQHCLAIADRLASWGYLDAAFAQVQKCDDNGASVITDQKARAEAKASDGGPSVATKTDLRETEERLSDRMDRQFEKRLSK